MECQTLFFVKQKLYPAIYIQQIKRLSLKALITTATDDILICFNNFPEKLKASYFMADDSHEISSLFLWKKMINK